METSGFPVEIVVGNPTQLSDLRQRAHGHCTGIRGIPTLPHRTSSPVEVWTDHANLQYFREPQKLNRRQARWLTQLQDYDYTLHHIPGKANSKADLLSRRAGFDKGEDDNKEVTLLKPIHFRKLYIRVMVGFSSGMEDAIRDALDREGREFPEETTGWSHDPAGLWEYYGRLYIPKDDKL
jgi:hypothetical protein